MQLIQIRQQARHRADMEHSQFVSDAELNEYIDKAYEDLYDILVSRYEDYYSYLDPLTQQPPVVQVVGGVATNFIVVPANFYKLKGLDVGSDGTWKDVPKFNFAERNRMTHARTLQYRIVGKRIYLLPAASSAGNYQLWYIPRRTKLLLDTDEPDVLDFEEYLIVGAAIRCMMKEESDISPLAAHLQKITQRIENMGANLDAGQNERIADVTRAVYD